MCAGFRGQRHAGSVLSPLSLPSDPIVSDKFIGHRVACDMFVALDASLPCRRRRVFSVNLHGKMVKSSDACCRRHAGPALAELDKSKSVETSPGGLCEATVDRGTSRR